jgi:hypothetical protein
MKRFILSILAVSIFVLVGFAQAPWPNLNTITVGDNQTCTIDGSANPATNPEKARLNRLKNRYRLPTGNAQTITFNQLLALNQGHIQGNNMVGFPNSSDPNNQRAVVLEGYVNKVATGGCSSGESCNCKTRDHRYCDTHIDVFPNQNSVNEDGRNMFVVEITARIRLLATQGLLTSNMNTNEWTTEKLRDRLLHRRVRFSGFLYFDTDHATEAWVSDPNDVIGGDNWRQTAWEVHPVMRIQVLN